MKPKADEGSYLWKRCYSCGHRLRFASDSCPQCGIHFDGRKAPKHYPERCECDRCLKGTIVSKPRDAEPVLADPVTHQELQEELGRLRAAVTLLANCVGAHIISQDSARRLIDLLLPPHERHLASRPNERA